MKIAIVNQPWGTVEPPVPSGSIPILIYQTARRLARSCDVVVYARGHFQQKEKRDEGVTYRYIPIIWDKLLLKLSTRFPKLFGFKRPPSTSDFNYPGYVLQIALELRQHKMDIVHIHNFSQFVPLIRALNPKIKIVLHMHCEWLTQLDPTMIERHLRQVDLVIGCSDYITNLVRQKFPQFADRCQTFFNAVDAKTFLNEDSTGMPKNNEIKQLMFVGRISPEKGLHVLLDAFQEVVQHYPNTQLKIVGPEESVPFEFIVGVSDDPKVLELASFYKINYFSHLKDKISSLAAGKVTFTGAIPNSKLVEYYQSADILINPSLSEAFGMALTEAMATEVPVIAARVGGMTDIVEEGKTGLLFEAGNAPALAKAIAQLLADESLRISMGKAGRQRVLELFDWEPVVEHLLGLYQKLCEGHEAIIAKKSAPSVLSVPYELSQERTP
ncbi:MAG TPA: glycosyltransferase family 4 protein [Allocoleopsis sp.]